MNASDHLRLVVAPHAQRFIDGHFGNDAPRPQITIPANETQDSDLILSRGIKDAASLIDEMYAVIWSVANYGGDIDPALKERAARVVQRHNARETGA